MTPEEAAHELEEELEAALADLAPAGPRVEVRVVHRPIDLGPEASFRLTVRPATGRPAIVIEVPVTLVIGYLADEEAAVDEWRRWVRDLRQRLDER